MTDNDMRDALYNAVYENFVGPIDSEDAGLTKRYPLGLSLIHISEPTRRS